MGLFDDPSGWLQSAGEQITSAAKVVQPIVDNPLVQGGISLLGGALKNRQAADAAASANAFSADQFATRYQTTVKDLEAAGLSPMLAYSQGGGSPPSGVAANISDLSSGFSSAYQTAKVNQAQVPNIEADTGLKGQSAALSAAQAKVADETAKKVQREVDNMPQGQMNGMSVAEWNLMVIRRTAEQLQASAALSNAGVPVTDNQVNVTRQTFLNLQKSGVLLDMDVKALKDFNNLGNDLKQVAPLLNLLRPLLFRH